MSDHYPRRRLALRRLLKSRGLDALLVTSETNVTYLSGFTGDSTALFITQSGTDLLVSDGRYETQIAQECPGLDAHIRPLNQPLSAALAESAQSLRIQNLGFEDAYLTVSLFQVIHDQLRSVQMVPTSGMVESLRMVKDRDEIAAIRKAVHIAARAFSMLRAGLRLEESEADTANALESYLRRCGAQGSSFPPIVAAGPNAALPHARPSSRRIADGDLLLIDWGASLTPYPYKSDLTRVLATGKVSKKFEKVYQTVLNAQERAIAAVRPGVRAHDLDVEARSYIEDAGFGPHFSHGLGHGIGLDIHEAPRVRQGSDDILQPGMIVTIEPGIYLPGWGGIRIEDDVLVTPDGHEVLTQAVPKDFDSARWP